MTMIHRRLFRPAATCREGDGETLNGLHNTRSRSRNILFHSARSAIHVVRKLGVHKNHAKAKWLVLTYIERLAGSFIYSHGPV